MVRLVFRLYTQVRRTICIARSLWPPPEFLWLRPPPGIVHHLSVPAGMLTLEPFSEDLGRSTVQPARGSRQSASFAPFYGFGRPLTRTHMSDSLVRVSRRVEWGARWPTPRAPAGATRARPRRSKATSSGHRDDDPLGGIIRPAWSPLGLRCRSTPRSRRADARRPAIMTEAHRRPHPLPSPTISSTFDSLFSKSFSSFLKAFDGIYRLYLGCIPKQPDSPTTPAARQGPGTTGCHPLWPHSMGLAPSVAEDASADYTNGRKAADSHTGLFPFAATRGILRCSHLTWGRIRARPPGHGGNCRQGSFFRARASTRLRATQGQGGRSHHCRAGRPLGAKCFSANLARGGQDDHLLAPTTHRRTRPPGGSRARGYRLPFGRVGPPRPSFLSFAWHRSPESGCSWCSPPTAAGSLTLSPPGAGSLTLVAGIRRALRLAAPAAAGGIVVQLARWVAPLRESTMILPQVHLRKPLLRLLLPLNDKVQWTSRNASGGRTANAAADPTLHRPFNR
ncbi:hypothetical protein H6P81_021410 [Aristolochia fimbriata]|uniref:Uncharacterized protein n=1 Tax=Aristolochia fimbriata TaxID=158543 RepID=A0AAV7DPZ5_ARIFI|nr:hypothetical protein H6P81_021410 [Aristolochia fimbriata]